MYQVMVWHSGLRGAMAFALAEMLDPATISKRSMLVATTLGIVLITTTVVGTRTPLVLRLLHIKVGDVESETEVLAAARRAAPPPPKSLLARWTRLDRRYIMPFLTNRYKTTGPKRSTDALSVLASQPSAGFGLARAASTNPSTAIDVDRRESAAAPQNPIDVDDDYLEGYDDRWLTTTTTGDAGADMELGGGGGGLHDGHALLHGDGAGLDEHAEQHEDHDLNEHDDNDGPLMRSIGSGAGAALGSGSRQATSGSGSGQGTRASVASGLSGPFAPNPSTTPAPFAAPTTPATYGTAATFAAPTTPATFATSVTPMQRPSSLPPVVQPLQSATSDSLYAHF